MGTSINTPLTGEIWHLTIDDLLEPITTPPRLAGPGPFVINLSASTAPISVPMKAVAEHPGAHVYQIQRTEDHRVRYRLRLGPFETEAEAEALLSKVRELYPGALTASAEPEDLRSIEAIKTRIDTQQLAAVKAAGAKAAAGALRNVQPLPAHAAPPQPAGRLPAAPADGEALPTSPPPAWLALRSPSPATAAPTVELGVTAPVAKPAPTPPASVKSAAPASTKAVPGFAPARWSAAARAFVPSADFASAPAPASSVAKGPAIAPGSVSRPATPAAPVPSGALAASARPAASASSVIPRVPAPAAAPIEPARPGMTARPDIPVVSASDDSLIPVLLTSMAVCGFSPASRPAASSLSPLKVSGPALASSPAPAGMSTRAVVTALPVTTPAGLVKARTVSPAYAGVSVFAANRAASAGKVPVLAVSSPAPAPGRQMMPGPPAAAAAPRMPARETRVESFDTTQTLRPLTPAELEDPSTLRWFVIQLSCSEEPFDPDALPNLDIFNEYQLYSVASLDQGKLLHMLRVGFFSEDSHAKAVAGYLGTFFDNPTIRRASAAERTRFAQHRVEARKDIGGTGKRAIIEITDERVIRPKRSAKTSISPMRPPLPTPPSARGR